MWTFVEILINFYQAFLMIFFMQGRLHVRRESRVPALVCTVLIAGFFSLYLFIDVPVTDTLVFLFPLLYGLWASENRWIECLFWDLVLTTLFALVTSATINAALSFPGISVETLMGNTYIRALALFATNLFLGITIAGTRKIIKTEQTSAFSLHFLYLLINVVLWALEELIYTLQMNYTLPQSANVLFLGAYGALLTGMLLFLGLYIHMTETMEKESRLRADISSRQEAEKHQNELVQLYERLRMTQHDLRQHQSLLETLVHSGDAQAADAYLHDNQTLFHELNDIHISGLHAFDALVTTKRLSMKKQNIDFRYSGSSFDRLPLSEFDLCSITGNLLDNAMEGLQRIPELTDENRWIRFSVSESWDMFYIFCQNPCNMEFVRRNRKGWLTAKNASRKDLYGTGIKSIESITERYKGTGSFSCENGIFSVQLVFPLK